MILVVVVPSFYFLDVFDTERKPDYVHVVSMIHLNSSDLTNDKYSGEWYDV
jgi:hypothetical protein